LNLFTEETLNDRSALNFERVSELLEKAKGFFGDLGYGEIEDVIKTYTPQHKMGAENEQQIYDHGIASALLSMNSYYYYKIMLEKSVAAAGDIRQAFPNSIRLAFNSSSISEDKYNMIKAEAMFPFITSAVCMHNIYPEVAPEPNGSIKLIKSPMYYLLALSDALQVWDRKKRLNPAVGALDIPIISKEDVGLQADGKHMLLSIENMKISQALTQFRKNFEKYLEGVGKILLLNIKES